MALTLVTAPTRFPVTLDEVKDQLRISHTDSDSELTSLIVQATNYVEEQTGRRLITQTWKLTLDHFENETRLPYPPLSSISSITYQDQDNATQTLASSEYTVDTLSEPGRLVQAEAGTYPTTYNDLNSVTINFVCGYGDRTDVPEQLKQAIKLYIQWIYDMDESAKDVMEHLINANRVDWFSLYGS